MSFSEALKGQTYSLGFHITEDYNMHETLLLIPKAYMFIMQQDHTQKNIQHREE